MQPSATELLRKLAPVLRSLHVRWYVFGAQAVIVHGFIRQTADVDVTVEVTPEQLPGMVEALRSSGFVLRVEEDVEGFIARTRVLPLVDERTGFALDVVLAGPGLEEGFLDRAIEVEAGGVRFPVISVEDLIVVKILAGRAKDLEDVRGVLLRSRQTLALDEVRRRLRELEQLLDQSDLVPELEALLARLPLER